MTPRVRFIAWTVTVVALLGGQLAWLYVLRGPRILNSDAILIGGQIALTLPVLLIAALLTTTPADAIKLRSHTSEAIILAGVALLQFSAVTLLWPGLSEDVLRYRVDGRMWLAGVSPYATTPNDFSGRDAVDSLVPFPHMHTIYPAVSQATFALAAAIDRDVHEPVAVSKNEPSPWRSYLASTPSPYCATVFRAIYASAAVGATVVLLLLLRAIGQSPWWAALFAWNPLATIEVGGMGHQDVVGVLLVLLGILAVAKKRTPRAAAMLALAAAVKPFAFLLAPFVARHRPAAAIVFVVAVGLLYLPPASYQRGYVGWRESARTYSQSWEANGSAYEVITRAFGAGDEGRAAERAKGMARLLGACVVIATALAAWRFGASPLEAGYWLCLATLLVAPVVYPWYLLWPMCFVPLLRGRAGWTAMVWSGTVGVSYLAWHQLTWRLSNSVLAMEYGVVYATLLVELALVLRRARARFAERLTDAAPAVTAPC
jgi:hypothetical protein